MISAHAERYFLDRVLIGDDCWLWTGSLQSWGYGDVHCKTATTRLAHRLSYEVFIGPIPAGLHVCHTCDNPPCVNPAHLFVGTPADNQRDKARKGRAARWSRNAAAKLTDDQFLAVIERVAAGETQVAIAREFGVSPQAVCQFLKRHRSVNA